MLQLEHRLWAENDARRIERLIRDGSGEQFGGAQRLLVEMVQLAKHRRGEPLTIPSIGEDAQAVLQITVHVPRDFQSKSSFGVAHSVPEIGMRGPRRGVRKR